MLDKHSIKNLKWFKEHSENSYFVYELNRLGLAIDYSELDWLYKHDCLDRWLSDDAFDYEYNNEYENPPYAFRISPGGLSKLEEHKQHVFSECRAWITAIVAVAAFVLSVIALVLQ